jgi:hypothetical protein
MHCRRKSRSLKGNDDQDREAVRVTTGTEERAHQEREEGVWESAGTVASLRPRFDGSSIRSQEHDEIVRTYLPGFLLRACWR